LGSYRGELGNGGDKLVLMDSSGRELEAVRYETRFPWPVAADALGAADSWLGEQHTLYGQRALQTTRGYSLHRLAFEGVGGDASRPEAWQSGLATPTRALGDTDRFYANDVSVYASTVVEIDVKTRDGAKPRPDAPLLLRARLEPFPARVEQSMALVYWYKLVERGQLSTVVDPESTAEMLPMKV
jgi:hypothetical protein